uniref:Uncharacterized protein n=1 Tax=Rhizophora mucronata TaxID=61149 RepID=A0A2P2NIH7_RHIMU
MSTCNAKKSCYQKVPQDNSFRNKIHTCPISRSYAYKFKQQLKLEL